MSLPMPFATTWPIDPAAYFTVAKAFWAFPTTPWSMYQSPLMAWMITSGVPASVAAPAARATTSAMDAADAARQQAAHLMSTFENFSAYRSDGGHASAQIINWPSAADLATRSRAR
jgi:hypothetical protein